MVIPRRYRAAAASWTAAEGIGNAVGSLQADRGEGDGNAARTLTALDL
jgi:hypothetical protein